MKKIRVALAQLNLTVGDLDGNSAKIIHAVRKARKAGCDIVCFPELAVTGYPPEDLLLKHHFITDNISALDEIKKASENILTITGFVDKDEMIHNAAAVISDGRLIDIYHKKHLPNYGVFDEYRYFKAGKRYPVYDFGGIKLGLNICEDIWYDNGPARIQSLAGAEVIININASPYHLGKASYREDLVKGRARECGAAIVYVNMVGGQDELVFDGGSLVVDTEGKVVARAAQFEEDLIIADIATGGSGRRMTAGKSRELKKILGNGEFVEKVTLPIIKSGKKPRINKHKAAVMSGSEEVYNALILGTRDYVSKNGFKGAVIGMSGGVDSALVSTIAVDALGRQNVRGIFMPSPYTSEESREDALGHAENLGISIRTVPIDQIFKTYNLTLKESFRGREKDITEENLQARIRGNILMAFSNKFGCIVLTTGNKSEMSVGYATLYGDMAGGFAVIKDVPKTLVYELCKWRNDREGKPLIPERVLWKEPTAELKPDQRDTDSLPPYEVLDPILKAYVEEDQGFDEISAMGCDVECTKRVINMVDHSEYKRRQAPPGVKITPRAFGKDRRFPITNKYRNY